MHVVFLCSQSAALQKRLRHLEVQLNNDKQIRDDLEHKCRYNIVKNIAYQ